MNRRTGRGDEEGRRERGKGQTVEGGMEGGEGRNVKRREGEREGEGRQEGRMVKGGE